jgi:MEMO1 family protein
MVTTSTNLVFAGLAPHPPIIIPQVGRGREKESQVTVEAMKKFASRFMATSPDLLVLLSPHSPRRRNSFGYWPGPKLKGDLSQFTAPHAKLTLPNDLPFMKQLSQAGKKQGMALWPIDEKGLDHGAMVPLYYLWDAGWWGPTIVLGLSYPGETHLDALGKALSEVIAHETRRIALIASGDMSHCLSPDAPGGYCPEGKQFDQAFVRKLKDRQYEKVHQLDENLVANAGQDVLETTEVVLKTLGYNKEQGEVLSYEGPFGVGYTVAIFREAPVKDKQGNGKQLLQLARETVEAYVKKEEVPNPQIPPNGYLKRQAGAFVTVWRKDGSLRGCIGVLQPTEDNLMKQVVDRAIAVADYAYGGPIVPEELDNLTYEVSILHPSEPVKSTDELDPSKFGVIVHDDHGRRAVLLPGIKSITSIEEQLGFVRKKAGIPEGTPVKYERFRTDVYHEEG